MTASAWAVVVAGGSGARFGGHKQFASLGGRQVVEWSLDVARSVCAGVVLVVPEAWLPACTGRADAVVAGGGTRAASVRAGLDLVPEGADVVVVHDAARPLASAGLWRAVIGAVVAGADAAVPCVPVTDTIKQRQVDGSLVTLERSTLVASQTPQAFCPEALRRAHAGGREATDDAALLESLGCRVVEVPGEAANFKLTGPSDLRVAELLLEAGQCS